MSDARDDRGLAALFVEYRRTGDRSLRNQLIERNAGLAQSIARRYFGRGEQRDDLVQVAMLGLLKAVERFEPERGLAFSSFASPTIEGELKRHFRDRRWAVRVPRSLQEATIEVSRCVADLGQELGRSPTVTEIASGCRLSPEQVLEALEAARAARAASLDAAADDDDGSVDRLGDVDAGLADVEHRVVLARLLRVLPEREQAIVTLRFYDGLSQSQIARRFGISQMQVSRLLARSLERLRAIADDNA